MKSLLLLIGASTLLLACGTMSTYQKVTVPYQYLPLKPHIVPSPYFVTAEPATIENLSLVNQIHFRTLYGTGSTAAEMLPTASTAEEARLLIKLSVGEVEIVRKEPASDKQMIAGNPERKYRYIYRMPVTARFYTADQQLIWEHTYNDLMQHYSQLQSEADMVKQQPIEISLIKEGYFKYLQKELVNDFTKLFYNRNLNYDAIIGESGPQKRMTLGNISAIRALNLARNGQQQAALSEWKNAVEQYENLINDQTTRKNGQLLVSVREKAIAYYNCAQAHMWLRDYNLAQTMISVALNLSKEYHSDSTNSDINSDRFMFPRLQEEISFRQQSTQAAN